jgi:hypothetical protein
MGTSASNVRHIAVRFRAIDQQICMISGIAGDCPPPSSLIWDELAAFNPERNYRYIDVGTATMNMLLAAHALISARAQITTTAPRGTLMNVPDRWTVRCSYCSDTTVAF